MTGEGDRPGAPDAASGASSPRARRPRPRLGRILFLLVLILVLAGLLAPRLVIGPLLDRAIKQALEREGADVSIERLRFGYFSGIAIESISISYPSGDSLDAENVKAGVGLSSLFGDVTADSVKIESLKMVLTGRKSTVVNAGPAEDSGHPARKKPGRAKRSWRIGKIRIDSLDLGFLVAFDVPIKALGVAVTGPLGPGKSPASKSNSQSLLALPDEGCNFVVASIAVGKNLLTGLTGNSTAPTDGRSRLTGAAKLNGGGQLDFSLEENLSGELPEFALELSADGVLPSTAVVRLLRYIHPVFASLKAKNISGVLGIKASLTARGGSGDEILDSLSGKGSVTLTGGSIGIPAPLAAFIENRKRTKVNRDGTVPLPSTNVEFTVKDGKIHNDDLKLGRSILGLYANGWTSTRGELDQLLLVKSLELTGKRGVALAAIIGDGTIPLVHVTGVIGGKVDYAPCLDRVFAKLRSVPRDRLEKLAKKLPDADREKLVTALEKGQEDFIGVLGDLLKKTIAAVAKKHTGSDEIVDQASTVAERFRDRNRMRKWKKRWKNELVAGTLALYRKRKIDKESREEVEALDEWLKGKGISPHNIPVPPKPDGEKKK
ncbi:MAG: hypothetical protein E3J72_09385 [Planctomycetota bacterium]|nr:MAG: hypothetical protein E3J72_09385 [Planctomycetota bacterium]